MWPCSGKKNEVGNGQPVCACWHWIFQDEGSPSVDWDCSGPHILGILIAFWCNFDVHLTFSLNFCLVCPNDPPTFET